MFRLKWKIFVGCLLAVSPLVAAPSVRDFAFDQQEAQNLIINNRILLKVNGKPISVMDVARKMDLLFYRQYPNLTSSPVARYQFYMNGWRTVLGGVIDDCLIMADAEEKKIEVSDGEVREELERLFGPDVVLNLDKLEMTLDEAFELLKTELVVQKMTSIMVRSKAMTEVYPQRVKERYEKTLALKPTQNFWIYRILSVRGEEHEQVANRVYRLIAEEKLPFEEVASRINEPGVDLSYSEEFRQREEDLSLAYRAVLETLSVGVASLPVSNKRGVSRIFCLQGIEKIPPPTFNQAAEEVKRELLQEAMVKHNGEYRTKLRDHYGLSEKYLGQVIPDDLRPFALR